MKTEDKNVLIAFAVLILFILIAIL